MLHAEVKILKIKTIKGCSAELLPLGCRTIKAHSAQLLPLHQEVLGPRCEMPGIEVRSTKSRCEVPWVDVHSTQTFILNWGAAHTWLGQLLVSRYIDEQ